MSSGARRVAVTPWLRKVGEHGGIDGQAKQMLLAALWAVRGDSPVDLPVPILATDLDPPLQIERRQEHGRLAAGAFPAVNGSLRAFALQLRSHIDGSLT